MKTTPDAVVATFQRDLSAMTDPMDIPRNWSQREVVAYESKREALTARITLISQSQATLAALAAKIEPLHAWADQLNAWRDEFSRALLALPARERGTAAELMAAIKQIDRGCTYQNGAPVIAPPLRRKLCAAFAPSWDLPNDLWARGQGGLLSATAELKDRQAQRASVQQTLDDALLDDAARAQKEKDAQDYRDLIDGLRLKNTSDGFLPFDADGELRTDLTPAEVSALARWNKQV